MKPAYKIIVQVVLSTLLLFALYLLIRYSVIFYETTPVYGYINVATMFACAIPMAHILIMQTEEKPSLLGPVAGPVLILLVILIGNIATHYFAHTFIYAHNRGQIELWILELAAFLMPLVAAITVLLILLCIETRGDSKQHQQHVSA